MTVDMLAMGQRARRAMRQLQHVDAGQRTAMIHRMAERVRLASDEILAANAGDVAAAEARALSSAMIDRLMLTSARVTAIANALDVIAALPDPIGRIIATNRPGNGLDITRVSVPLGVIGIVYESRPNVTADAAAICLKSANAVILRGGSESAGSSRAIVSAVRNALQDVGVDPDAVQMVPSQDRALVGDMLTGLGGCLDVVVPRGGRSLVERVQREARVPVIGHLEGLCHLYLDAAADAQKAIDIALNAKLRRTGICGAAETLLIDAALPQATAIATLQALADNGCEIRGCEQTRTLWPGALAANEEDWRTEYLAAVISVRVVDGVEGAIAHIAEYGSGHTDSIITEDAASAEHFLNTVDSAIVMHNTSTQFADGGEFGMGAEIGISTSRIHARGPVGAAELTSYKYRVISAGKTRD